MGKIKDWIQCGNDCEECPFTWEEKTSYEYDEYDYGCYIKGDDFEDKPCHLVNPFRYVLGVLAKRKFHYYEGTQWEGYGEWFEEQEEMSNILTESIMKHILSDGVVLGYKSLDKDEFRAYSNPMDKVRCHIWEVREDYDNKLLPKQKTLKEKWIEVLKETRSFVYEKTLGKLVPYIKG